MIKLTDEFDNNELDHFTNYDYFLQLVDNGRHLVVKEFITTIETKGLLTFLKYHTNQFGTVTMNYIEDEIIKRTEHSNSFKHCPECGTSQMLCGYNGYDESCTSEDS